MDRRDFFKNSIGSIVALGIFGFSKDSSAAQSDVVNSISLDDVSELSFLWNRIEVFNGKKRIPYVQYLNFDLKIAHSAILANHAGDWYTLQNGRVNGKVVCDIDYFIKSRYSNMDIVYESNVCCIVLPATKINLKLTEEEFSRYGHMIHDNISIEIKKDFE